MTLQKAQTSISVIVSVYNTRKYLKRCLDALISQTISSMEIIIIDDCSDENIYDVVEPYLKQDKQPVYYERLEQHKGPGGARNRGITISSGKYIAFCDSDDWVDINYYEDSVQIMERYGASMGMCSLIREYDYIQTTSIYKCKYDREIPLTGDFALKALTKQIDIGVQMIPSTVNKIYSKEYLDQINLRFMEGRLFEDLLFSFISYLNAPKIICIPLVTYHHYKRPNSIVQSFDKKHIDDFIAIFFNYVSILKMLDSMKHIGSIIINF